MITGAHIMIQSRDDAADKAFLADVLKLNSVDAGQGFLIFGVPPAEIAVHKSEHNDLHELYFMCDDIHAFVADMKKRGVAATDPVARGWGKETEVTMPGGGKIGVYQPNHPRPVPVAGEASEREKELLAKTKKLKKKLMASKKAEGGKKAGGPAKAAAAAGGKNAAAASGKGGGRAGSGGMAGKGGGGKSGKAGGGGIGAKAGGVGGGAAKRAGGKQQGNTDKAALIAKREKRAKRAKRLASRGA